MNITSNSNQNINKYTNIGIIGLSTMGSNLALNFAKNQELTIHVYNRTLVTTDIFLEDHQLPNLVGHQSISSFLDSPIEVILLLVKAGEPTDNTIKELLNQNSNKCKKIHLVDLGNSHIKDSQKRFDCYTTEFASYNVCGISGGSNGALNGASMMFSGSKNTLLLDLLKLVAAKDFNSQPTVGYFGSNTGGNLVKTIHNGIEYAQMQLIAEIANILQPFYGSDQTSTILQRYSQTYQDFLLSVFAKVYDGRYDFEKIAPIIGSKGTGKWTTELALLANVPAYYIPLAYNLRLTSYTNKAILPSIQSSILHDLTLADTLLQFYDQSYKLLLSEGVDILKAIDPKFEISEVLRVWQGGCIIQNHNLKSITQAQKDYQKVINILQSLSTNEDYKRVYQLVNTAMIDMITTQAKIASNGQLEAKSLACCRNIFGNHEIIWL
jgi:6-phosphogluconate dehydrogenase